MTPEKLKAHNDNQKLKRELRRYKVCCLCNSVYRDNSERINNKTCSKECAYAFGVKIRRAKGTYIGRVPTDEEIAALVKRTKEYAASGKLAECRKAASRKRYGVDDFTQSPIYNDNKKVKCLEKHGVEHPSKLPEVIAKAKKTNLERYGYESAIQNPEIYEKVVKTRIERGLTKVYEGKTMQEWSNLVGVSYSYFKQVCNEEGFEQAKKLSAISTDIEAKMAEIIGGITNEVLQYNSRELKRYFPDFILPESKLIIECDGLAWHSDRIKSDNKYHAKKQKWYEENGYTTLFFRCDEIKNKPKIVSSIIRNKLVLNTETFWARKLKPRLLSLEESKKFFTSNHLMGPGSGRTYALAQTDGKPVAAIQVRWKNKQTSSLEISRFCCESNTTVCGGYSKLLSVVTKAESPKEIITFVDRRYGTGYHLLGLGFQKTSENISFQWTDCEKTCHRMTFPGNTGYSHKMNKIWDCGQALYTKKI